MTYVDSDVHDDGELIEKGYLSFAVEARLVRELGERLVKEPEIALLELIKNAYDADAKYCDVNLDGHEEVVIVDDGNGMTLSEFKNGWMRIGTSSKETQSASRRFNRPVSGEKGIGRFAVRYLGKKLVLTTVAENFDEKENYIGKTKLEATFDWPTFDHYEDLGKVKVPYKLLGVDDDENTGTMLRITNLRAVAKNLDLRKVRTASIELVSPYAKLLEAVEKSRKSSIDKTRTEDPGFSVQVHDALNAAVDADIAGTVLENFILRAVIVLREEKLEIELYRRGENEPRHRIVDIYSNSIGKLNADIRFYPRRKGTFVDMPLDGRTAWTWVRDNSGVAVFDGRFRVFPYGHSGDDWLGLSAAKARNERDPESSLACKHFPMTEEVKKDTGENYMLRLPYPYQLIGAVRVRARRQLKSDGETGLIPSADREGFVHNKAFKELRDIVRGAVELIALGDRELQHDIEEEDRARRLNVFRQETKQIIAEVQNNASLRREDKNRIISRVQAIDQAATDEAAYTRRKEQSLEIMSLLGVVAGFMTHEFGVAIDHLQKSYQLLDRLSKEHSGLKEDAKTLKISINRLEEFVVYSEGYIRGAQVIPEKGYPVLPRISQMTRIYGKYAEDRGIAIEVMVDNGLLAPRVPVSLYNGLVLNLFTNALKAVTAKSGKGDRRIAFRAWNEGGVHFLEVSDTGVGIPSGMRSRVFDPLFTTTESNRDPLGSGMGLGLTLVKRGVEAFSGKVEVVDAPPGFSTCFRVKLSLEGKEK